MKHRLILASVAAASLLLTAGCRVQSSENSSNGTKNVRVETPLGGLHVRSNNTTAAGLGLPVYPGATPAKDHDGTQSANIHIGLGKWRMQVKMVHYRTPDSQDKVLAFYQQALGRFGNVIRCQGTHSVGTPTSTNEGLTCADTSSQTNVNMNIDHSLSLKAGSLHHQHILAIDSNDKGSGTDFSLVEVELPTGSTGS